MAPHQTPNGYITNKGVAAILHVTGRELGQRNAQW